MDKDISTLLREIQQASGLTQPQLADKIGTSQPTVNRILNGQSDCLGKTLRAITDLHRETCFQACAPHKAALRHKSNSPTPSRKP